MARKKSAEAEVCDAAIDALKDVIRDLEVIKNGRGTDARFWTVRDAFWKISQMLDEIDPYRKRAKETEGAKPKPVALIGQQTLFALEDKS